MELCQKLSAALAQEEITSLNLEDLFSVSFIVIDDLYVQHFPNGMLHRPGPTSNLADSEVITIAWVGEMVGIDSERAWHNFVKKEFCHLFPYLSDRTRFNRRRRNLWAIREKLRQALNHELPLNDIFIVDSVPVPLCDFKRAHFSTSPLKCQDASGTQATYGHCDTKGLGTFLGFRVHLIISYQGVPVDFSIANANLDEREVLWTMCETGDYPLIIGDKGYVSASLNEMLFELDGIRLLAIKRENQKPQYTPQLRQVLNRIRRRIETTISQLNDQFHLCRIRARNHWGMLTRIIDKLAGFSLSVLLNRSLGRPLMETKDLVFA